MTHHPYSIRFAPRAVRDLDRMPEKVAAACVEFIFGPLADNPHRVGKPLADDLKGHYSARRGAYRVLYRIFDTEVIVEVAHIDHRAHVYRQ